MQNVDLFVETFFMTSGGFDRREWHLQKHPGTRQDFVNSCSGPTEMATSCSFLLLVYWQETDSEVERWGTGKDI